MDRIDEKLTAKYRLTKYRVALVRDSAEMKDGARRISTASDIVSAASDMAQLDREQLRCYFLDARHNLIGWEIISIGTVTASLAHPREIMKGAILSNSSGFVLVHYHPSGDSSPPDEDNRLTKRIAEAGRIMGIELLDHIIVAEGESYSYKTAGAL